MKYWCRKSSSPVHCKSFFPTFAGVGCINDIIVYYIMLRKIRQILASTFYVGITLLFLDFTGTIHTWLGWMAKIQFMPALFAANTAVLVFLLLLTLVFGRVYCSVICPLGVMQDVISHISGMRRKKKNRFTYSAACFYLRSVVLAIFIAAFFLGVGSVIALLSPYSSYGRIVSNLFAPIWQAGNNVLAYFAERVDSYSFYSTDIWIKSIPTFVIALVTFVVIFILPWRNGRTYCNTVCPVGTILGYVSRFSLFRVRIDGDRCKSCGLCSRRCKSSCIDYKNSNIDYTRCVTCMNCLDSCKHGAIHYESRFCGKKKDEGAKKEAGSVGADNSRRTFLTTAALVTAGSALKAQEMKVDGGLAEIADKKVPERSEPILPPGALSKNSFAAKCTGCQLCVSVCPNQVLRPSTELTRLMQPEMSYERGYCRPECTKCSEVCPTGAIQLVSLADKSSTQIGHAVFVMENCVAVKDKVECGNCARHCPSAAINMIRSDEDDKTSLRIPSVDVERCIGCGACENLCPSRPYSAIYVEGHVRHRII